MVFFDTEGKIISADYRAKDNLHVCVDEDGLVVMRNMRDQKDFKKVKVQKDEFKYIKFNPLNDFQYFLCAENSFKIYDVRSHLELDDIAQFADSVNIFGDSSGYLLAKREGITIYNTQIEVQKQITSFGDITHANMKSINFSKPDIIVIGNENGDLFCSN